MWQLKKSEPSFIAVDGDMKGKSFTHGVTYQAVPKGDKGRFEKAKKTPVKAVKAVEVNEDA